MKCLDIEYEDLNCESSLEKIYSSFDVKRRTPIDVINWDKFNYKPEVSFRVIYSDYGIYIKYDVFEQSVLATKKNTNDPVYKDSCVEFFVSPGDGLYYNFEFNCIGTKYAGFGESRDTGGTMDNHKVDKIRTYSTLGDKTFNEIKGDKAWSLIVEIPFEIFTDKSIEEIKSSSMKANFYKCGDDLSVPHFVSWNNIDTDNPDFHRPEYFGLINFK